MITSILTLTPSKNARIWSKELAKLGVRTGIKITEYEPSLDRLVAFFGQSPNWIYFTGHYLNGHLRNYFPRSATAGVYFYRDRVQVHAPDGTRTLYKDRGFNAHRAKTKVIMFGGCSVCHDESNQIPELRELFGNPLILGYARGSVWRTNREMFSGVEFNRHGQVKRRHKHVDFFDQVGKGKADDLEHVREAWLRAVIRMIENPGKQTLFRAIDPDGTEWKVVRGKIRKGRSFAKSAARPEPTELPALHPIP